MRIHVSNLPSGTTEEDLRKVFEPFGRVRGVIMKDPGGEAVALVEMPIDTAAMRAIIHLNWTELKGRRIRVQQAPESRKGIPAQHTRRI